MNFVMVFLLLASSPVALILFVAKALSTDFDTAWETFENFIEDVME